MHTQLEFSLVLRFPDFQMYFRIFIIVLAVLLMFPEMIGYPNEWIEYI
jgi:hypothetical protein